MSKTHACWCYSLIVRRACPPSLKTVQLFSDHDVVSGGLEFPMSTQDPYVLVVDVGVNVQNGIEKLVARLKSKGIRAERLSNVPDVASRLSAANAMPKEDRPCAVLNFHHMGIGIPDVNTVLSAASQVGIPIINRFGAAEHCGDRPTLKARLRALGVLVPDFFFGRPQEIPASLGDQVVLKGQRNHLVAVIDRLRSRSCGEMVYVERLLQNPHLPWVRCVYVVCEYVFTANKFDDFVPTQQFDPTLDVSKGVVDNDATEVRIARKIAQKLRLNICSIEFIGGFVIDVNECPDFFFHEPAIEALAEFVNNFTHGVGTGKRKRLRKRNV